MRAVVVAAALFCTAADAADTDTVCATVYTYLAQAARSNGMASDGFESAANTAQNNHLATNPADDAQRYALNVIDGAQAISEGLSRGAISSDSVMGTAASCNQRYFAQNR